MLADDAGSWEKRGLAPAFLFGVSVLLSHAVAAEVAPNPRELLDRYHQAVTAWDQSVSMRSECDHSMAHRGRDFRHWKYDTTHRRDGDRCEWFGRYQFEGKLDGNPYSFNEEFRDLVQDGYYLHYSRRDAGNEREAFAGTDVRARLFMLQAQAADGGFLQGRTGGIGSATHQAQVMRDSNDLRYLGQETLGGTLCQVVEAKTKYGTFTVWLAPEKGYNALKSRWRKSGRDILRDDVRIEDQGIAEWTETVEAVDVQEVDGVFLPVSGQLTRQARFTDGQTSEDHSTARRSDIVLHPDFRALGAFQIVLPEGTEVRLTGGAPRTFRWSNGKFTPDIDKYLMRTLLGKPLPGFDGIRVDLDPAGLEGKMLVVCLFDMQQRPSRNTLMQLTQETELLAKNGAVIIGIQVGPVGQDKLGEWLQANGIHALVGATAADEEETRCAWGARSLPWLILTDAQHIVRAEGLALRDLDDRIETIRRAPGAAGPATPSGNDAALGRRSAVCVIKDPQGRVLANDRIAVSPALAESPTDAEGKLVIHYAPPTDRRGLLTYLRHKNPDLIGSAWLPPAGGQVEVQLEPAVSVQGRVLDPNGKPSAGVQVAALPMSSQFVLTNAGGDFDIAWAPEWAPGANLCLLARHPELNLTALVDIGPANRTIEVRLEPGLTLAGTVEEPNGAPIPAAAVRLALARGWTCATPVEPVPSDAQGRWRMTALPQEQEYRVSARADNYGPGSSTSGGINAHGDIAPVDPIILKRRNRSVSGVVIDVNGLPVSGAGVVIDGQGQPRAEGVTDAEGRFTLAGICDGTFALYAAEGRQLHGQILDAQPGQLSDEIVLFREVPRRAQPAEGPFEADPQPGILKYRWSDRGWRLLEGKDWQRLQLTPDRPAGVVTPNPVSDRPLFGRWQSPATQEGYRWVMLERSCRRGQYDRLIMDTDGDGRLDDEQIVAAYASSQPSEHAYVTAFGPVPVLLDKSRGPAAIHLSFGYYGQDRELCVGTVGWYEGYVSVGGTRMPCLLADKNADGTFTTPSSNPAEADLVGLGDEERRVTCSPGGYVELDGNFYRVTVEEGRDCMKAAVVPAEDVRLGTVRLPESISELAVAGANGSFTVHPKGGIVRLPAGSYQLHHWLIKRTDTKGQHWILKGQSFHGTDMEVIPEREMSLDVGEPVLTSLERIDATAPYCTLNEPKLTGRRGEMLELDCREGPARAQARLRNADGTYDRTFTFEYG